jgi:hypothetical protein
VLKKQIMRKFRDFRRICWTHNSIVCACVRTDPGAGGRFHTDCVTHISLLVLRVSTAHACTWHGMKGKKTLRTDEYFATNVMFMRLTIYVIFNLNLASSYAKWIVLVFINFPFSDIQRNWTHIQALYPSIADNVRKRSWSTDNQSIDSGSYRLP